MNNAFKPQSSPARTSNNRLVGWLVSFAQDEKGKYHELRAGRTFIASKTMNDVKSIVVSENSISAPHMVLHATAKHELTAQDIFSDSGTYLTRNANGQESKLNGPTPLRHGDWIRIGSSIRFQVCLVDGASK